MHNITITVSGKVASGKTRVAYLMRNTLQAAGFTVDYVDSENAPGTIDGNLDEALANLAPRTSVHIGGIGQTHGSLNVEVDKESTTLYYAMARALVARGFTEVYVSGNDPGHSASPWTVVGVPPNIAKTLSARLARIAPTSKITIVERTTAAEG